MSEHTRERVWTDADILQAMRTACAKAPSQAQWARSIGMTPSFVNDILNQRRPVNAAAANAVGFCKRVTFHQMEQS